MTVDPEEADRLAERAAEMAAVRITEKLGGLPTPEETADLLAVRLYERLEMQKPPQLLEVKVAAKRLSVSDRTLIDWLKEDPPRIPFVTLTEGKRKQRRIAQSDLDVYIASLKRSGGSNDE